MQEPMTTSLSSLSDHEWHIISNTFARGWDWSVGKVGKKWQITGRLGQGFPLFKTKTEAYEVATKLVRREALHRSWVWSQQAA